VADWCEFELDYRYLPGMNAGQMLKDIRGIVRRRAPGFKLEIEGIQMPYEIEEGHPLVAGLKSAFRAHGIRPKIRGSEGATVITFFQHEGIPAVATGFGVHGCAHTADEFVILPTLYKGARVIETFLRQLTPNSCRSYRMDRHAHLRNLHPSLNVYWVRPRWDG